MRRVTLALAFVSACMCVVAILSLGGTQTVPVDEPLDARIKGYTPYDGAGRYTMEADDGVRGIQGLEAVAQRFGVKPYEELSSGEGVWQTERVIFRDVDTGATVVRLTNDPWADQLSYFKGNWTADGKCIVFRRRPGMWESSTATHGPMAMRSDGTDLRNVFRDFRMVRKEVCSPTEPGICYAMADGKKVVAFDVETGITDHLVREVPGCWHLKVSLDGKYLMGRSDIEAGGKGLWTVSADGSEYYELSIPDAIHDSYQFTPAGDKAMYWYEGRYRAEGFVMQDFRGGEEAKVNVLFDWNHGDVGLDRGAHTGGYVTRIAGDTWLEKEPLFAAPGVEYYDDPHTFNGYLTWSPKDQLWVYSTRILRRPHISEIHCYHAEPVPGDVVNRYRLCFTGVQRPACLDNPGASPDGTKVLFNSSMFGRVDAYYVVARLPEEPVGLQAERTGEGVRLTWTPPAHHAEVAGYHVYRSRESGTGYTPVTETPAIGTESMDTEAPDAGPVFYAVTAVEHSGLESGLSVEAAVGAGEAPRRIFLEAEAGERTPAVWLAHQGLASGLHYVWMRKHEGPGGITIPAILPEGERDWRLWASVKGADGVDLTAELGGQIAHLESTASSSWGWVQAGDTMGAGGETTLTLSSGLYGTAVDCVVLTDDADFTPGGRRILAPKRERVEGLEAEDISPYAVRLSWEAEDSATFHHYNVYCGADGDFAPSQASLVASPDAAECIDWGLKPGASLHYRVTCVDRWGNETPASEAVEVTLPGVERVVVEKPGGDEVAFEAPSAGTYTLWLKLKDGGRGGNYIDAAIDGEKRTWTCAFDGLSEEAWFTYGQWGRFELEAGAHTLTIDNKTKHTIESVLLTNDQSLQPDGHIDILSGW